MRIQPYVFLLDKVVEYLGRSSRCNVEAFVGCGSVVPAWHAMSIHSAFLLVQLLSNSEIVGSGGGMSPYCNQ